MSATERRFAVLLQHQRVGVLHARDDFTWFALDASYVDDPKRAVLGLRFEQDLRARHSAHLRLPPWFSNLLPEGRLREWIAQSRGVPVAREMELLAQAGRDLPGAVEVVETDDELESPSDREIGATWRHHDSLQAWHFSLAGVQMKFSMLAHGERFTAPAIDAHGDWIVKLPDALHAAVPANEFFMMKLAEKCGIEVPETRLVHRDDIAEVPDNLWPNGEEHAFAIRRFDRTAGGGRLHIEDFAQVRGFYPDDKYSGSFETLANLIYRKRDAGSAVEFARRLAFNVLIRNGDAHLKNWSLIYRDPRVPVLAPAYDLVSTAVYHQPEDLGLRFGGTRLFERVRVGSFAALQQKVGLPAPSLADVADEVVDRALASWPEIRAQMADQVLAADLDRIILAGAGLLRRR